MGADRKQLIGEIAMALHRAAWGIDIAMPADPDYALEMRRQAEVVLTAVEKAQAPTNDELELLATVVEGAWGDPTWDGETLRPLDRQIARAVLAAGFHRTVPGGDLKGTDRERPPVRESMARDADVRGEGICRTCLAPIWNEGGSVGGQRRDTGWSDRIERGGDSLVCFAAENYRHAPLTGREAEIYDAAWSRRSVRGEAEGSRAWLIKRARALVDDYRRYDDTEELVDVLVMMANQLVEDAPAARG